MDRLHRRLFTALLAPENPNPIETAIDVTMVDRYCERFADHAAKVAIRRLIFPVTGEEWPGSALRAAGPRSRAGGCHATPLQPRPG